MRNLFLLLFGCLLFVTGRVHAQVDAHFTQYYAYPQWLNPAFTGAIDGSYRISANYRKQWPSSTAAMTAQAVSADIALPKNFGVGATVFNQKTGDGSYQYNAGYLSLSYQVHLSEYKILSAGFQVGLLNRRLDASKLQFGSQFNPLMGYDPTLPSNENFSNASASSLDGSVGLLYFDANPNSSVNPFIGVSLYHPSEPNNQFLNTGEKNKIPARYSIHGGMRLKMNNRVDLMPNALYAAQGNANEIAAGLSMNIRIDGAKDLVAGAMYRTGDAIAPNIGLYLNGLMIGFSYDINMSQMKTVSSINGGYELSISFTKPRKIPDTKFICPRL
ncbi:PorP/SprF family type IX secretion system membrane protein [Sediminibacterium soli]|uniref:PorP/SprF family type IX secretion system membrane protein n=1 Tax=Sediminibacterium soli TaxID=2698829 RepID=UPI00137AFC76|nr:PorP/SprF family type IX secretion system membrane protein [Sediminibacterium soli]NCI47609.1 type IX secretion system membrane protein PorP/SprF [Sediminibacterium soli]